MVDQVADKIRRVQYSVTPAQVNFIYPFAINEATDLKVYLRDPSILPDDSTQIIFLNVDYTVTGVGLTGGGLVITTVAPPTGHILTIDGDQPIERLDVIAQGNTFNSTLFNKDLDNQTIFAQQLETKLSERLPTYETSAIITDGDLSLPVLADQEIWKGTATGISAATFEEASGFSTLRSDLASQANGADGALIVGYYDAISGGITVKSKLDDVSDFIIDLASQSSGSDGASLVGYFDFVDGGTTVKDKLDSLSVCNENFNYTPAGNFDLNPFQRGTSFPVTVDERTADRFSYESSLVTAAYTQDRLSDAPSFSDAGYKTSLSFRSVVTTDQASIPAANVATTNTVIEGFDYISLYQRKFHISFWVNSSVAGVYSVAIQNSGSDRSFVHEYTINTVNTWEFVSFKVLANPDSGTWDFTNGVGITLKFVLAAGSDFVTTGGNLDTWINGDFVAGPNTINHAATISNQWIINSLQVMPEHDIIPFQPTRIEDVIEHCQRYFEKSYDFADVPGTATFAGASQGASISATQVRLIETTFTTRKRGVPTMTWYSPSTGAIDTLRNVTSDVAITTTANQAEKSTGYPTVGVNGTVIYRAHWTAEAEF